MTSISIITPCYNAGSLIAELADNLREQSCQDFEWLICDDGSDPETLEVLEQIEQRPDIDVRVFRGSHRGGNFNRNLGFNASVSGLVKFVDADDLLGERLLEYQLEVALANKDAVVVSPTAALREDGSVMHQLIGSSYAKDPLEQYLKSPGFLHGGCLIPRHMVDQIGAWDESLRYAQDLDFFRRLFLIAAPKVIVENRAEFFYRHHNRAPRLSNNHSRQASKYQDQMQACLLYTSDAADE